MLALQRSAGRLWSIRRAACSPILLSLPSSRRYLRAMTTGSRQAVPEWGRRGGDTLVCRSARRAILCELRAQSASDRTPGNLLLWMAPSH